MTFCKSKYIFCKMKHKNYSGLYHKIIPTIINSYQYDENIVVMNQN